MPKPVIRRNASPEAVAHDVASTLLDRLVELQKENGLVELCLCGGRVANLAYEHLGRQVAASGLDAGLLELWWTDDALVPTDDPQRHSLQALSRLAGSFPLDPARAHPMPPRELSPDPSEAAVIYGRELEGQTIDVCLLTIGPDGHVAALYPGHPSSDPTVNLAVGVVDAPVPPPERVSLSLTTINRCREVWVIGTGSECATAVAGAMGGDPAIPAAHVQGVERTRWFLDDDAAAKLPFHHCRL